MNILKNFFLIALFLTFFLTYSMASERREETNRQSLEKQPVGISQRQAISIAQKHIEGRVLDIRRSGNVYRVKILSDQGSIHIVPVSVTDGKIKSDH
ncbi:PepSY domain-containing protein [Nitrosomonas sp.]|uniref:PepSY domain-containing protein n=1 Tax=Nitrosomonas sp. TaxID=42353 RepID=UPI001DEAF649|nr:PepSY domain-containing protein [Nitrosomonas sp.]MCB1948521.1 PepSY domain-containing protein [Nitrosomonas sp.]MCP5243818.1 PepSY domain-containing protein [Burkholderiales bacterium]MCP5292741.1 PepSY domain-containing protein [Burkholderiales bacterium]MDR4515393.1 PepSY domain-containing protein [Nitrosomonas sp.]